MTRLTALALVLAALTACGTVDDATIPVPEPPPVPTMSAPDSAPEPVTAAPAATAMPELTMYVAKDLIGMSAADLRLARNTLFARHGRAFQSEDLQAHFGGMDWYTVDDAYSDDRLTDAEKAQVALIASFEGEHNPTEKYEFTGTPRIVFPDAASAVVVPSDDMYEGMIDPVNYSTHGSWVMTWSGPRPFDQTTASDVALYRLDYDNATVVEAIEGVLF